MFAFKTRQTQVSKPKKKQNPAVKPKKKPPTTRAPKPKPTTRRVKVKPSSHLPTPPTPPTTPHQKKAGRQAHRAEDQQKTIRELVLAIKKVQHFKENPREVEEWASSEHRSPIQTIVVWTFCIGVALAMARYSLQHIAEILRDLLKDLLSTICIPPCSNDGTARTRTATGNATASKPSIAMGNSKYTRMWDILKTIGHEEQKTPAPPAETPQRIEVLHRQMQEPPRTWSDMAASGITTAVGALVTGGGKLGYWGLKGGGKLGYWGGKLGYGGLKGGGKLIKNYFSTSNFPNVSIDRPDPKPVLTPRMKKIIQEMTEEATENIESLLTYFENQHGFTVHSKKRDALRLAEWLGETTGMFTSNTNVVTALRGLKQVLSNPDMQEKQNQNNALKLVLNRFGKKKSC